MADILGSSGVDVDFATGRPRVPAPPEAKANKARLRFSKALLDSWQIQSELHENKQLLKVWLEKYRDRLLELAEGDPVCQALEAPMMALRVSVEFKPILAEKVARKALGPEIEKFL